MTVSSGIAIASGFAAVAFLAWMFPLGMAIGGGMLMSFVFLLIAGMMMS